MEALLAENKLAAVGLLGLIVLLRYTILAGGTYFVLYKAFSTRFQKFKIQKTTPSWTHIKREILLSMSSLAISVGVISILFLTPIRGYTRIYTNAGEYEFPFVVGSLIAILVIHDLYFYLTHRLLHTPALYAKFHRWHHMSNNPTPLAALAFHPVEGLVQVGVLVLIVLVIPVHISTAIVFALISFIYNVYGHCGYEILPKLILRSRFSKWFSTSTFHNLHHERFQNNYGLYSTVWDRAFGTLREDDFARRKRFFS